MCEKLQRNQVAYSLQYEEELDQLYNTFKANGEQFFGRAFWQLGTRRDFVHMCYRYTQPGAIKSKHQPSEQCLTGSLD